MQGRVPPFFPRQTVTQNGSTVTVYRSSSFELSPDTSLVLEARVYGLIGATPTIDVALETSNVLYASDDQWYEELSIPTITSGGGQPVRSNQPQSGPQAGKYGRARIVIGGADVSATLEVIGFGRSG